MRCGSPSQGGPEIAFNSIWTLLAATKELACHLYQIADMTRRSVIDVRHSYNTSPKSDGLQRLR